MIDRKPRPTEPIELNYEISARRIRVSWKPVDAKEGIKYQIEWTRCVDGAIPVIFTLQFDTTYFDIEKTVPGDEYWIKVECRATNNNVILRMGGFQYVKAIFNDEEQMQLYQKAVDFVGNEPMRPIDILNRCQKSSDWAKIKSSEQQLMEPHLKDGTGQPANRINGVLSGTFFYARVQADGTLPDSSTFGDQRLKIGISKLLDPDWHNFHFADFYCIKEVHYMTIVVSRKGSASDDECRKLLHPLNIEDNRFIQVTRDRDESRNITFEFNPKVWVEIYYTEKIPMACGDLEDVMFKEREELGGVKATNRDYLKNNKTCKDCNLYPIQDKLDQVLADIENEFRAKQTERYQ